VSPKEKLQKTAEAAKRIMEEKYQFRVKTADIAKNLGVSRITLFRYFTQQYGMSPKEYLMELRLQYACRLLKENLINKHELGDACGLPGAHYFCRVFKKRFGVTSKQWQKNQGMATISMETQNINTENLPVHLL